MHKRTVSIALAVGAGLTCAAFAVGLPRGTSAAARTVAAPASTSVTGISRREYLARIVAETAARTADETARRGLTARSTPVESPTRMASAER